MFIKGFKIYCVEDSEITDDMINKIIDIKKFYWDYSYEEHKNWMKDNIYDDEYHLIILNLKDEVVAYLTIIGTHIAYNEIKEEVLGVGNVCVNPKYSGKGIGQLLMNICNYYLDSLNKRGVLLCKKHLIKFYEKSRWIKHDGEVYLMGNKFHGEIMFTKSLIKSQIKSQVIIERNF